MTATDRGDGPAPSLDAVRVAALARDHFALAAHRTAALPGAAVVIGEDRRSVAVVSEPTMAVVGGVLLWAIHTEVRLDAIVVDGPAGFVDQWLQGFATRPAVLALDGRALVPPEPHPENRVPAPPAVPSVFEQLGADVVIEHGFVLAEVDGLEVARVQVGTDGRERIEVGVGRYDRAAHRVTTSDRPIEQTLADVVADVRAARRAGSGSHTLNRLCRERWLRAALVREPQRVGLAGLAPVDPLPPRSSLLDVAPAPAMGTDPDGASVLVMASVGIDPGLVPATSAVAQREGPDRVIAAVPPRDRSEPNQRLLESLRWPAEMAGIEPPWD